MVLGIASFACMDTIIKWMTGLYPVPLVVALRSWFGLPWMLLLVYLQGGFGQLHTRRPGRHFMRYLLVLGLSFTFFWALSEMKLVDAITLTFIAPILVAVLSVPILKEVVGKHRWAAIIFGFIGVVVILRPGSGVFQWASVVVLGSALCYALLMVSTRAFKHEEHGPALMFWPAFGIGITGLLIAPFYWIMPPPLDLALFAAAGFFGSLGIVCLTHAFRLAPASLVSPFEYTAMIWATLLGYLVWGELPDTWTVVGGGMVIASGLYILYRETRQRGEARPALPAINPDDPAI